MPFLSFLGPIVSTVGGILQGLGGGGNSGGGQQQQQQVPPPSTPLSSEESFFKRYMGWIIGIGAVVVGGIIWLVSKPKKGW